MINKYLIFIVLSLMLLFSLPALSLAVSAATVQLDSSSSDQEVKTSEWTDYNDSDPGVTILEAVSSDKEDGDPDRPLTTGNIYNEDCYSDPFPNEMSSVKVPCEEPETTGIENEDIGVAEESDAVQYRETDFNFVNRIGAEYTWKVEEKDMAIEGESGDAQVSAMNKSDLIESIASKSDGGLRSADLFMKISDIKGESSDEAATKKPREIVVVGSKVRDEGVPQLLLPTEDPAFSADSFFDVFVNIEGGVDLQLYVVATVQSDENIEEVILSDEEVSIDYRTTVHLFGFIPVETTQRATITFGDGVRGADQDKFGRVKVKMPWWHVFGRKEVRPQDLKAAIEEELESKWEVSEFDAVKGADTETEGRSSESIAPYFAKIQAQAFQLLSNIMKTKHDTAKSAINNVR